MYDFGIRAAVNVWGWRIYLRGYARPLDADRTGTFDFTHALAAFKRRAKKGM